MTSRPRVLVSICARHGSKGVRLKNVRPLLGVPLIAHTIRQALAWPRAARVIVSTDSEAIGAVARQYGAETPFVRPAHLATDTVPKMPVLIHALETAERHYGEQFDVLLDLDPTSPVRTPDDIERGWLAFQESKKAVCFSVVRARKNPYFNMVERDAEGHVRLVKSMGGTFAARQAAPAVFDMNASIYFYTRGFLLSTPQSLWEGDPECFEMGPETAFDIDEERDFLIIELMMQRLAARTAVPDSER
ncbi:MAG TPA: acylneuraminate cytidylyltransferase family protein [Vicinamibacterales bacterium]|nr:acylneuraminate cytidylyltransferase family protein [Vicinamibacterales bacterium]